MVIRHESKYHIASTARNKWQRNQDVGHKTTFRVYMYIFTNLTTLLSGAQDRIHRNLSDFIPTIATLRGIFSVRKFQ